MTTAATSKPPKDGASFISFNEANEELEQVTPEYRAHPDVLEARWQVFTDFEKWEGALELADAIAWMLPGRPEGYLYMASSLRELGREIEALLVLLQGARGGHDLAGHGRGSGWRRGQETGVW